MNKFITLVFLTALIQLSSVFVLEAQGEILTTKKTSRLSYILPLAKISIGTCQTLALIIMQTRQIRRLSILGFFQEMTKDTLAGKGATLCVISLHLTPYITGSFLINSGIQDLKKLNNKNTP